jgi:uncharacterized protein YecA (UPF0149 family)
LEIACGVARNKYSHLQKVIGIAIDAPKDRLTNSEDFVLIDREDWPDEVKKQYEDANREWRFFETADLKKHMERVRNFPAAGNNARRPKIGRNEKCPCGSGMKFKKCHGIRP